MKFIFCCVVVFSCITQSLADISPNTEDEKKDKRDVIIELTKDNFETALKEHKHIVIFFYNSDCHGCKEELNEYLSVAKTLREAGSHVRFALLHGGKQLELAEKLEIKRYPIIRLINNGDLENAYEYKYVGRKDVSVLSWLVKLSMPVRRIDDSEEFEKVMHKRSLPIGFFRDANSSEATVYHQVAKDDPDTAYAMVTNTSLFEELGVEGNHQILFFKADGTRHAYDGPWDAKSIRVFVDALSLPTVVKLSPDTVPLIRSTALKRHAVLFASKKAADFNQMFAAFEATAKRYRGKVVFILDDIDSETDEDRLRDYYGIEPNQGAQLRMGFFGVEKPEKFKPTNLEQFNVEILSQFVEDVLNRQVTAYSLSQPLPEDWDASPVKVLVTENFQKVTNDQSRAALVLFTSPWCSSCAQFDSIMNDVAKHFKNRPDVIVAKMDGALNDVEGLHFRHALPSIRLYPKGSDEPVEYRGSRSIEALKTFVESNGKEVVREKRRPKDEL